MPYTFGCCRIINWFTAMTDDAPTIDTEFFASALATARLSRRKLARLVGVDPSAISLSLRGKRELRMHEAAAIAQHLGVPVTRVLEAAGISVPHSEHGVPLIGTMDGNGEVQLLLEDAEAERVDGPGNLPAGSVAVMLKAAHRGPWDMLDGWLYYFLRPSGIAPDIIGTFAVVRVAASGLTALRFVRRGYRPGTYNLDGLAVGGMENVHLDWAAPVLWIKPNC